MPSRSTVARGSLADGAVPTPDACRRAPGGIIARCVRAGPARGVGERRGVVAANSSRTCRQNTTAGREGGRPLPGLSGSSASELRRALSEACTPTHDVQSEDDAGEGCHQNRGVWIGHEHDGSIGGGRGDCSVTRSSRDGMTAGASRCAESATGSRLPSRKETPQLVQAVFEIRQRCVTVGKTQIALSAPTEGCARDRDDVGVFQ